MSVEFPPAAADHLPDVHQRPGADVVIYDGHCRMCRAQMMLVARFDRGGRLAYLSLHDPEVARRWPDLKHDDLMRSMVIIDTDGGRHWGAEAVRYLSRRLPLMWWLAPLLHIPFSMPLWQAMYRLVARNRYRFGRVEACTDDACQLHR